MAGDYAHHVTHLRLAKRSGAERARSRNRGGSRTHVRTHIRARVPTGRNSGGAAAAEAPLLPGTLAMLLGQRSPRLHATRAAVECAEAGAGAAAYGAEGRPV